MWAALLCLPCRKNCGRASELHLPSQLERGDAGLLTYACCFCPDLLLSKEPTNLQAQSLNQLIDDGLRKGELRSDCSAVRPYSQEASNEAL